MPKFPSRILTERTRPFAERLLENGVEIPGIVKTTSTGNLLER